MPDPIDLLLLGCGNMGAALAAGYARHGRNARIVAVDPQVERAAALLAGLGEVKIVPHLSAAPKVPPRATIIALKPQSVPMALPDLARQPGGAGLVISIAAGIAATTLETALPDARVIRAMPNTPALIGKGVTALLPGRGATEADRDFSKEVFGAVGTVRWIDDEQLMDGVTAVSGSGPAYVFAVAEAFIAAAQETGLGAALARDLVVETLAGAAAMLRETDRPVAGLKEAVRSPAGTTDAALCVFEDGDALVLLFRKAILAAGRRARELGAVPAKSYRS